MFVMLGLPATTGVEAGLFWRGDTVARENSTFEAR
jgi:hypothetical protein